MSTVETIKSGRMNAPLLALTVAALALAGCNQPQAPEPEPEEAETAVGSSIEQPDEDGANTSILRSDMDARPIDDPPLEPLEMTVPFGEGGTALNDNAKAIVASIIDSEQFAKGGAITLRGHTDSSGYDEANLRASKRRAEAVSKLLEESGASIEKITIIAMGEQNPIAPNGLPNGEPDEAGRATNRRVEVIIAPPPPEASEDAVVETDLPAQEPGDTAGR
ncbi:OmpA family protein [Croceicoccus sp. Ery15]|uniref:OmpA family protein n=1 Tax=Croceicoccus sp. Ery15 TaxID=1703338 RepID=UPI001E39DB3B|nr:OmpA family protein [Croceicoccus sp. Ery15]